MENRIQERIQAKTRDGQLYEIFVKQFEFSPKTAEAAINVVKEIYELHRIDPNRMCATGQVIRQLISVNAKHGPRLREIPKVNVRLGPSISHKAWIVRLYLEYKTYSEIARATRHSTTSIKRYIKDFARVVLCLRKGLSIPEIVHIAGISERLAKEYTELYLQYNTPEHAERLEDLVMKAAPEDVVLEEKRGVAAS